MDERVCESSKPGKAFGVRKDGRRSGDGRRETRESQTKSLGAEVMEAQGLISSFSIFVSQTPPNYCFCEEWEPGRWLPRGQPEALSHPRLLSEVTHLSFCTLRFIRELMPRLSGRSAFPTSRIFLDWLALIAQTFLLS